MLLHKPAFKPHLNVEHIEGEGIFLISERGHTLLTGRLYELVVPLVNGSNTSDGIIDMLEGKATVAEICFTLEQLHEKGHIIEAEYGLHRSAAAFWSLQGVDPQEAEIRLGQTAVRLAAFGGLDTRPFMEVLNQNGIVIAERASLGIAITDDYLRSGLDAYNRQSLESKKPWILIKPVGIDILIGPLFIPGQTGCWQCLKDRCSQNREVEKFIMDRKGNTEPLKVSISSTNASLQVAWNIAAREIAKWIVTGKDPELEGKLISLDTLTWKTEVHTLTHRPQCPACGKGVSAVDSCTAEPVRLQSRKITYMRDGGHRTISPEETIRQYQHLVSPITGIVTMLERDTLLNKNIHVYASGHNFAMNHRDLKSLKGGLRSMSMGKGMTDSQAKASALCEAIERHSGVFQGHELRKTFSFADSDRSETIHPNECMRFSERQYRDRAATNAKKSRFNIVPEPFDETLPIEWSPVWSLTDERFKYLPTQYLYYNHSYCDGKNEPGFCIACSNGSASGNTIEEAVLQGFFELVERDAVALWWYNMLRKPSVDLDSFDEPYFSELVRIYKGMDRDIWVLEITSDLGIPAFAAVSCSTAHKEERIIVGLGCHLDAGVAVSRALTEMNQMLPAVQQLNNLGESYPDNEALQWLRNVTRLNQPYLVPDEAQNLKSAADYPLRHSGDLLEDILTCKRIVEAKGMEMLLLDQTRPDIGVSVAKVIVPGLRHFWARFGPGRLYDVPVRMGLLAQPLSEEDLNPIKVFF